MVRRSKEQWLSLFQQQMESGLSVVEFCRQQDIDQYYFSLRKKQLQITESAFIPVVIPKKLKNTPVSNIKMQCRFESCVLQFESFPDAAWLSQLIRALS